MKKAYKTRFLSPYTATGKTNIPHLREEKNQAGVYLIKSNRTSNIVYIGYSETQLYKTIYRHFQNWNDKQQERFVYSKNNYIVRVIFTTPKRAALLEKHLIETLKPRDNKLKYNKYLSDAEHSSAIEILTETPFITADENCPF